MALKFRVEKPTVVFGINWAVYPKTGDSLISYHDTRNRAELVTRALDHYFDFCSEHGIDPFTGRVKENDVFNI